MSVPLGDDASVPLGDSASVPLGDSASVPLGDEDEKLLVLARGARGRVQSSTGAAVRDGDGRTYAGADVTTTTLTLSALQVAIATALSSGAESFEAAVVVGGTADDPGRATLDEISPGARLVVTDPAGTVRRLRDARG